MSAGVTVSAARVAVSLVYIFAQHENYETTDMIMGPLSTMFKFPIGKTVYPRKGALAECTQGAGLGHNVEATANWFHEAFNYRLLHR